MGVESSAVNIVVTVTDSNSGPVMAGVTKNVEQLGAAGATTGAKVAEGMDRIGKHSLSSLDNVRLLRDDFGIHIPRAMEKAISQSALLSGAIRGIGTGLIAMGAIEIGGHVFEALVRGAQALWHNVLNVNQAVEDYNAEIAKSAKEDFGNTRSIETTRLRIDQATAALHFYQAEVDQLNKKKQNDLNSPLGLINPAGNMLASLHDSWWAHNAQANAMEAQRDLDRLNDAKRTQMHEERLQAIEVHHTYDWQLGKEQEITAEWQKRLEINAENARFSDEQEGKLGNAVAPRGGRAGLFNYLRSSQSSEDYLAGSEAAKARADASGADEKTKADELRRIHEQAIESRLSGSALYHQQESAAIEDLKRRHLDTDQAVDDVHAKFHGEEMKRLQAENDKVREMREATQLAGLSGVDRARQEGRNKIADIYAKPTDDPGARLAEIDAVNRETARQIGELNNSFKARVDEIVSTSANRELQGFARIAADAQTKIAELKAEFAKNGYDPNDLARGEAGINAGAAGQAGELARRNTQETEAIEAQTRTKWFDAEKNKTAAIQVELEARKTKYLAELQAQEIGFDDYQRRVTAAEEEANAERVAAATEARKKMAGEFDSLFKGMEHPTKYLEEQGNKVLGDMAARLVQHVQQKHPGTARPQSIEEAGTGAGLLGVLFGGKKKDAAGTAGAHAMTQGAFSVAQATIQVGSAYFSGGGSALGSGSTSGGAWPASSGGAGAFSAGGGTGMMASGTTGVSGGFSGGATAEPGHGSSFSTGSTGAVSSRGGSASALMGFGQQAMGFGKQMAGYFGKKPGGAAGAGSGPSSDAEGSNWGDTTTSSAPWGMSGAAGAGSTSGGDLDTTSFPMQGIFGKDGTFSAAKSGGVGANVAAGGADGMIGAGQAGIGLFSQSQGHGGGGMLGGAEKGAQIGMEFGGPVGAAIGAAIGVGLAIKGEKEQARVYDLKEIRPRITSDQDAYGQGSMSYMDAYSDVQQMIGPSWAATKKMGVEAEHYWNDTIKTELMQAMAKFSSEEKAGRSLYTASGASYASGTPYVEQTGLNINHAGERIFSGVDNAAMVRAVTQGNSGSAPAERPSMGDVHLHVHAIDAKGVADFMDKNKHIIRGALNNSYAENSGGGL